jgi:hypothetical protein
MNAVVREGDTVVRDAGPWTPTVHRYLRYLHVAGIDWVPRPVDISLGADGEPERERLSYLHGDVPVYPLPDWVWADRVLCDGRIVGAIDFDFCSPGPRLWDIAYFATRIAPLTATPPHNAPGMDHARRRVQAILDAYGEDHWQAALAAFDEHDAARGEGRDMRYINEIGTPARADDLETLTAVAAADGLRLESWYGVRIAVDLEELDPAPPSDPRQLAALLDVEERLGAADPYRQLGQLAHLILRMPDTAAPGEGRLHR